jgi:hypothetical protein
MKDQINLQEVSKSHHKVFFGDKFIGDIIMDVDGYFYYLPSDERGTWSAWTMRLIADKLDELNKPWDDYIQKNL